jgi:hypothetical protein
MKLQPNPYRNKRDRSTLWALVGVLGVILLASAVGVWLLHSALR